MLKSSRNQFKMIKETNFGQDKLNENVCSSNRKTFQINSQTSVAIGAERNLPNLKMGYQKCVDAFLISFFGFSFNFQLRKS